jgi:putative nucleotidyltransferase with HDIG domain
MSPELSQRLTAAVDGMPAFPKSVQRILELTRDVNSTPKDLVEVIDKDPVVTVKILKVVNSAYYSIPKQVTSIGQAVVYLGFNTIKNLALSIAAIGMLPNENASGFDVQQYLLHSLATASLSKQLAMKVVDDADPMDCFIAGLLHDFGKVVFAQFMPEEFKVALQESLESNVPLHLSLQKHIGADHFVVGAMLAEKWRFAPELIQTIGNQVPERLVNSDMAACVFGANQIAKKLQFGFGGNAFVEDFPESVKKRLGGDIDHVIATLGDVNALFEEAKIFAKL